MAKTTKKQARETYDAFQAVLRNRNGGTKDENERMAKGCYSRLIEIASVASEQIDNASELLMDDSVLFGLLGSLPARAWRFGARYNLIATV